MSTAKGAVGRVFQAINPVGTIRDIVEGYYAYATQVEREVTRREEIWASRDLALAEIDAQRALFMEYILLSFAERAAAFESLFAAIDQGLIAKDSAVIVAAVRGIVDLAQTSPFAALVDLEETRALLKQKDVVWEI